MLIIVNCTILASVKELQRNHFKYDQRFWQKLFKNNFYELNVEKIKFIVIRPRHIFQMKIIRLDPIILNEAKNILVLRLMIKLDLILNLIVKANGKWKHVFRFKNFLDKSSMLNSTKTYILNECNNRDTI